MIKNFRLITQDDRELIERAPRSWQLVSKPCTTLRCARFSARLYGSRSHKTKRLLNELTGEKKDDEPQLITKSMKPEDVEDEAVQDLLESMQETQWRAMSLYAKYLKKRESEHDPGS